jgi:hypothetical protein
LKKLTASRWWPERLRIALCPDRLVVARVGIGLRNRVYDKHIVDCVPTSAGAAWHASIAALGAVLDGLQKPNAAVTIILSNHFVRYAIVPWRDSVTNIAEQAALARHCFKNIFGDVAANWDIRVSDGGFRRNAVASAVDRDLTIQLNQLFIDRKLSLPSVQPYFMTVCNRFSNELSSGKSGCFAVVECGRAAFGIYDHRGWQSLSARRLADVSEVGLAPVLAQELNSANLPTAVEQMFVAALEVPKLELSNRDWKTQVLQLKARMGFSPFEDARFSMALCGVA